MSLLTGPSPYGFGAILKGVPLECLASDWAKEDFNLFGAERGEPDWQSEWELHATYVVAPSS